MTDEYGTEYPNDDDTQSGPVLPQELTVAITAANDKLTESVSSPLSKIKKRASQLPEGEMMEFRTNFVSKYKPAILRWIQAYEGRVPFPADAVVPERFVERVGLNSSYYEYVFVLDGITLGVGDANGKVQVRYLNVAEVTAQMTAIPSNSVPPKLDSPVSREALHRMIKADSGLVWREADIKVIPTGISGAMNGGANVIVGGDIDDFVSWKYNIVFDSEGRMVYYLKGATAER